jgi:hypothetical protein
MNSSSLLAHQLNGELRAENEPRCSIATRHMQNGFAVFPLVPGGKTPALQGSFKSASKDPEQARSWWGQRDYNIGIATGKSSGVFVVDVDPRTGGDRTWSALCEVSGWPDTERVETSSGGFHLYFRYLPQSAVRCRQDALCPGVDVKAEGGYVVGPGSLHPTGHEYVVDNKDSPYLLVRSRIATAPDWILHELSHVAERQSDICFSASPHLCLSATLPLCVSATSASIIEQTLPKKLGQRNAQIMCLARGLKFDAGLNGRPLAEVKPIVRRWHTQALPVIGTKPFDETWADFIRAWQCAAIPLAAVPVAEAYERARQDEANGSSSPCAEQYDSKAVRLLVGMCRHLASLRKDRVFFLSSHDVVKYIETSPVQAWRWLNMLCVEGMLEKLDPGDSRKAARYRWIADDYDPVSSNDADRGSDD